MVEELKTCRNCGGKCDPTGWMCGDGRQGPECEGCGITAPDVESWNRLMGGQGTSQGGEAVEPACWQYKVYEERRFYPTDPREQEFWNRLGPDGIAHSAEPLYTHPADQVAEPDAELVELMAEVRKRCQLPDWARIRFDAKLASLKGAP